MKKILLTIFALISFAKFTDAQQWTTSTDTTKIHNTNSGEVGIGTSSPIGKLTVDDGGTGGASSELFSLKTSYSGNSALKSIAWRDATDITGAISTFFDGTYVNMLFGSLYNAGYNDTQLMTIMGNGNVGIGTTNPTTYGTGTTTLSIAGTTGSGVVDIYNAGSRRGYIYGTSSTFNVSSEGADFSLMTTGVERMKILSSNGNVGIGTTVAPDEKLSVNGNIHTKEVRVDLSGWSDYVFNKSYKLPALSFVKSYINLNHHLPDVPSEKEIVKNGLKIGEMQNILTKKVEELTLYMIDKDKQIAGQKKVIEGQQARLVLLEKQMSIVLKKTAVKR